jgi:hypothetical protein
MGNCKMGSYRKLLDRTIDESALSLTLVQAKEIATD